MSQKDLDRIWRAVLGELEVSMSGANFKTWVKNTHLLELGDTQAVVAAPNIFARDRLEHNYNGEILSALQKQEPSIESITYQIKTASTATEEDIRLDRPTEKPTTPQKTKQPANNRQSQISLPKNLEAKYNFTNFIVGSGNRLAFTAARQVTENPGESYNPLFLYGPAGVGKTHLMWAISFEIARSHPDFKILYVTSEDFTNNFINAIRKGEKFADTYRTVDVLLVDDLQFIAGKEKTQEEFFHTFNALHQANKQIVLCSDRPPKAIATLEDRLRSRFEWGMVADIQLPDFETRVAILQSKASSRQFDLPDNVASHLAELLQTNIRELEGALTRLIAHCQANATPITTEIVDQVIGGGSTARPSRTTLSPKIVIEKTAAFYDLTTADLIGPRRDKEIVVPRQVAMYIMREELGISFPRIASSLGGRDHTTIMHGVRKINAELTKNDSVSHEIKTLKQKILNG